MTNPIIKSLLDNDAYKFSMGQFFFHYYTHHISEWNFLCRNKKIWFTREMVTELIHQIREYSALRFSERDLYYLNQIPWLSKDYIEFLSLYHPMVKHIEVSTNGPNGLSVIIKGPHYLTTYYETPILAMISQIYYTMQSPKLKILEEDLIKNTQNKLQTLIDGTNTIKFSEFGTRRRLSLDSQEKVIDLLFKTDLGNSKFIGTSNVFFAKQHNQMPIGTMAHELFMVVGQGDPIYNFAYSNQLVMEKWMTEYNSQLGIILTDTLGTDVFLKDFTTIYATIFSGVRHDSGDPMEWGHKIIDHYKKLNIDPKTKTLLFSDSLDFEKANYIRKEFEYSINVVFGIGTYLSNDTMSDPLNIVIKPVKVNELYVSKISDSPGKSMCLNPEYVKYLDRSIEWRLNNE